MSEPARSAAAPLSCPTCRAMIPVDDVNIKDGVAVCRPCSLVVRLTQILESAELDGVSTSDTPAGCTVHDTGVETVITASSRSIGGALGTLAISLFWNGIVSVFLCFVVASTIIHLGGTLPSWFPAPGSKGGSAGAPMGVGMTLFMWVFLTPFLMVGAAMIGALFMCLGGRCEVTVGAGEGRVFSGVGFIGHARRFDATKVTRVGLDQRTDSEGSRSTWITIDADRTLKLGTALPKERQRWLAATLREMLVSR